MPDPQDQHITWRHAWQSDWQRLTGAAFNEETWSTYVHPSDQKRIALEYQRCARIGRFVAEYRLRCADGRYRFVVGFLDESPSGGRSWGYIMTIDPDHEHVCIGQFCFCRPTYETIGEVEERSR